jgi:hypothetical protein
MDDLAEFVLSLFVGLVWLSVVLGTIWARLEPTRCPQCRCLRARGDVREELVGISKKWWRPKVRTNFIPGTQDEIAWHENYRLHHRCKFCGHEWTSLDARKL